MVQKGNILFVKTGSTLGKSALVTGIEEDCTVNPQVVVIKVESNLQKDIICGINFFTSSKTDCCCENWWCSSYDD